MSFKPLVFSLPLLLMIPPAFAGSTADAIIGGGIGGATGAAIGNELGGRDGAILGGALGGATGAAIASRDDRRHREYYRVPVRYEHSHNERHERRPYTQYDYRPSKGGFCPPGQHKKGRC